jgi:hypothetical protein
MMKKINFIIIQLGCMVFLSRPLMAQEQKVSGIEQEHSEIPEFPMSPESNPGGNIESNRSERIGLVVGLIGGGWMPMFPEKFTQRVGVGVDVGVSLGYKLTPRWIPEIKFIYSHWMTKEMGLAAAPSVYSIIATGGLTYEYALDWIIPRFSFGIGMIRVDVEMPDVTIFKVKVPGYSYTTTDLFINIGPGVNFVITDSFFAGLGMNIGFSSNDDHTLLLNFLANLNYLF